MSPRGTFDSAWRATALYVALALATTWPLALGLGSSLPSDLGDPVLNAFILEWGLTHVSALAGGDLGAFRTFWDAPIFHPEPLALAYSEHLVAQAVTVWPLHALGANILHCYNVLFLSTFVLSGLGMYLLTRELTGSGPAAFVGGLLYGFALYRVPQFPHLQTLSSAWLPFALYGLRRFFVSRRLVPLLGAVLAIVAQNLSNGYYLLFFAPLIAAYSVVELLDRGLYRDRRALLALVAAAVVVVAATVPALVPYLALRQLGFVARQPHEVQAFSADALAWITAAPANRVWGWLRTVAKPEGELFPGFTPIALALFAAGPYLVQRWRASKAASRPARRLLAAALWAGAAAILSFTLLVEATSDSYWRVMGVRLTMREPMRGYVSAALLAAVALWLSPRARAMLRGQPGGVLGFFIAAAGACAVLALGPTLEIGGVATGVPLPYSLLYYHVPGFDGLRVPARFAMAAVACLSIVAAFGAQRLASSGPWGRRALAALGVVFAVEATSAPISLDARVQAQAGVSAGPARVYPGPGAPEVYDHLVRLPKGTVVIEFPFGVPAWDLPFMFYQRRHGHPLVNGYSGGFPRSHHENRAAFDHLEVVPEVAWHRLLTTGATHAVVHRHAFARDGAARVERWLRTHGAQVLMQFGADVVYEVPR